MKKSKKANRQVKKKSSQEITVEEMQDQEKRAFEAAQTFLYFSTKLRMRIREAKKSGKVVVEIPDFEKSELLAADKAITKIKFLSSEIRENEKRLAIGINSKMLLEVLRRYDRVAKEISIRRKKLAAEKIIDGTKTLANKTRKKLENKFPSMKTEMLLRRRSQQISNELVVLGLKKDMLIEWMEAILFDLDAHRRGVPALAPLDPGRNMGINRALSISRTKKNEAGEIVNSDNIRDLGGVQKTADHALGFRGSSRATAERHRLNYAEPFEQCGEPEVTYLDMIISVLSHYKQILHPRLFKHFERRMKKNLPNLGSASRYRKMHDALSELLFLPDELDRAEAEVDSFFR